MSAVFSEMSGLGSTFSQFLGTVGVYKEYNISRHFNSQHNDFKVRAISEEERKQKAEDLRKKLSGQRSIFKKGNSSQQAATHAS